LLGRDLRLRVRATGATPIEVPVSRFGGYTVGPVRIDLDQNADVVHWSVEPSGPSPATVDAIGLVWDAGPAGDAPRVFVQGYQSWSPTRAMRLGVDADPSRDPRTLALVRAAEPRLRAHLDPAVDDAHPDGSRVAVAPEEPDTLEVGTGEAEHRDLLRPQLPDRGDTGIGMERGAHQRERPRVA